MTPLRKKPTRCHPWQEIKSTGMGCSVHLNGLREITYYDREYCCFSELYEKKDCKYETAWQVLCRICERDARICKGQHEVVLETPEVVVLLSKVTDVWDYGYTSVSEKLSVFSKKDSGHIDIKVKYDRKDWMKKTLAHIKEHGIEPKLSESVR